MPEIGDIIGGKYRVLRTIGVGGMGVVFEALHLATDKHVALKCLHPDIARVAEAAERLKREARATGRINHPNVVAVHDCGEHEGQLYLVIELLHGSSLRAHMAGRQFTPEAMCSLLFPALRGVAAAHAAGVLHRDLKPENVFLVESPDGLAAVPKVLDFGLARFRDKQNHATLSAAGSLMGTYQYMAPEQLRSQASLDERVDVYALGAIAYELLTCSLPYRADNPVDLALQILESEAPLVTSHVPTLPHGLALVIARALARDRESRFPSVADFAGALANFAGGAVFRGPASPSLGEAAVRGASLASANTPNTSSVVPHLGAPATRSAGGDTQSTPGAHAEALGTPFHVAPHAALSGKSWRESFRAWQLWALAAVLAVGVLTCALAGLDRYDTAGRTKVTVTRAEGQGARAPNATGPAKATAPRPAVREPTQGVNSDWAVGESSTLPLPSPPILEPSPRPAPGPRAPPHESVARPSLPTDVEHGTRPAPEPAQRRAGTPRKRSQDTPKNETLPAPRSDLKHTRAGRPSSALKLDEF